MRKTLENLWNNYFSDECSIIDSEKEKELAENAVEKHKIVKSLLTEEQCKVIEDYVDTLNEFHNSFVKKAFFKGCEFAISFFLEASNSEVL